MVRATRPRRVYLGLVDDAPSQEQAARLEGTTPASQIVLLIDEVEAHLHPKWQRMLIPALLEASTNSWLESPAFELERATSPQLERALEVAEALLAGQADLPPELDTREKIDRELRRLLPSMDPFWLQWGAPVDEASQ